MLSGPSPQLTGVIHWIFWTREQEDMQASNYRKPNGEREWSGEATCQHHEKRHMNIARGHVWQSKAAKVEIVLFLCGFQVVDVYYQEEVGGKRGT